MEKRNAPKIDIVPLVDVLMVLIIFFLMSMQFQDLRALNVKLPKIQTAGSNALEGKLIIGIQKNGDLNLNGNSADQSEIEKVMKNISKTTPDTQVLIAADEDSPLKHITNVVDLCRNSGLENFRLQSR